MKRANACLPARFNGTGSIYDGRQCRSKLITRGLESKTHRGVIQLLNLHFVKDGPFPGEVANHLSHLETYRELSDYTAIAQFTKDQAREELARAEAFVVACRPLVGPSKTNYSFPT